MNDDAASDDVFHPESVGEEAHLGRTVVREQDRKVAVMIAVGLAGRVEVLTGAPEGAFGVAGIATTPFVQVKTEGADRRLTIHSGPVRGKPVDRHRDHRPAFDVSEPDTARNFGGQGSADNVGRCLPGKPFEGALELFKKRGKPHARMPPFAFSGILCGLAPAGTDTWPIVTFEREGENNVGTWKGNLGIISAGRVLDVGTGRGEFVSLLAENLGGFVEMIGIDRSERAVAAAASSNADPRIRFEQMDAGHLTFSDGSFDTVCISNSLHHLPDPAPVLDEMMRVLRPGGLFVINEMFRDNQAETQMTHVLFHHWSAAVHTLQGVFHVMTHTRQEILGIAAALSLEDVRSFEVADPGDLVPPGELEQVATACDRLVESIKDRPEYERLKQEGERVKARLFEVGFASATQLFVLGTKPMK